MKKLEINKGMIFGRLKIIEEVESKNLKRLFLCECECGNKKVFTLGNLRFGVSKSCGCLRKEITRKNSTKHGKSGTSVHGSWRAMINRCARESYRDYHLYGGRGIKVCKKWMNFEGFFEDMGDKPDDSYSLERINNDGNYCKENCKWATSKEQANNRRKRTVFKKNEK